MAIIDPARVIHDRVKTDAFDRNSSAKCCNDFIHHIAEPFRPAVVFDAGFSHKYRFTVKPVQLGEQVAEGRYLGSVALDEMPAQHPLVMNVIIGPDDVEVIRMSHLTAAKGVQRSSRTLRTELAYKPRRLFVAARLRLDRSPH